MRRKTPEEFKKEMSIRNPLVEVLGEYCSIRDKVKVSCKKCRHIWEAYPRNLLKGTGCPICYRGSLKKSHAEYIKEVAEKHPNIIVLGRYESADKRVSVKCQKCGYIWNPIAQSLISGHGCPSCNGNASKTSQGFISELAAINKDVEVIGIYSGTHKPIEVRCKKCGYIWKATPHNLLQGSGCIVCAGKKKKTQEDFICNLQAVNKHILVIGKYISTECPVQVRCLKCGYEWKARPHNLLAGSGCPECANVKTGERTRKTQTEFEKELLLANPYIKVIGKYENIGTPLLVQCKRCRHQWLASPGNLLRGSDCPNCLKFLKTSFPEQALFFYIKEVYPKTINGYKDIFDDNKMELDIFIPEIKTGIEYDGATWHRGKKANLREAKKYSICKEKGVRLIRIKEHTNQEKDADIVINTDGILEAAFSQLREYIQLPDDIDFYRDAAKIKAQYLTDDMQGTTNYFVNRILSVNPTIEVLGNYINSSTKIKVRCKVCNHVWHGGPGSLIKGHGCPKCAKKSSAKKNTKTHEQFIYELNNKNPDIFVIGKYITRKTKLLVKCKKCGAEWETAPANLLAGHGCMKCSPYKNTLKTNEQFIKELKDKNPNLEPIQEYKGTSIPMKVRCRLCGEVFEKTPSYMLRGYSCHKCKEKK